MPEFLPPQQHLFLHEFLDRLTASAEGQRIRRAWESEKGVPPSTRDDFLATLDEQIRASPTMDPLEAMGRAIEPRHQMVRPVRVDVVPERLSNTSSAARLLLECQSAGMGAALTPADADAFHLLCANRPTVARDYLPPELHGRGRATDLVWWTAPEDVAGLGADELVDRLALDSLVYSPCTWLIEVDLPRDDVAPCAVPTVLDAGRHSAFRPVPLTEQCGRTAPHTGSTEGVREWVSRPPSTKNATVRARGHVERAHGGSA